MLFPTAVEHLGMSYLDLYELSFSFLISEKVCGTINGNSISDEMRTTLVNLLVDIYIYKFMRNMFVLACYVLNGFYSCRMFENRVPHMLDNDYTPYSALDIFVKDLVRLATVVNCKLVLFFYINFSKSFDCRELLPETVHLVKFHSIYQQWHTSYS